MWPAIQVLIPFGIIAVVLIAIVHFATSSSSMDQMRIVPSAEYWKFLKRKPSKEVVIGEIPPPPDGVRDYEVEALIMARKFRQARELLQHRMEEARLAPVGGEKKLRRVAHYTSLLPKD